MIERSLITHAWNWELPNWPYFEHDLSQMIALDKQFPLGAGSLRAYLNTIGKEDYPQFVVQILSSEGLESSKIEGELLDRESLQSSIRKNFGLSLKDKKGFESDLVQKGALVKTGELRHTRYWLNLQDFVSNDG